MKNIKLSAPWITFSREVSALFEKDPDVTTHYNDTNKEILVEVKNYEKAQALKKILPKERAFGGVTVKIKVQYDDSEKPLIECYETAFKNNPAFSYTFTVETTANPINYVIFAKEVVQYWNDDLSDPHGVTSTLYENIAEDIFGTDKGIIFSTDSDKAREVPMPATNKLAQPTKEEIKTWEKYNGAGSYSNGSIPKHDKNEKPVSVRDYRTFKSVFKYNK